MPRCIVRYRAHLMHISSSTPEGEAIVRMDEEREPDEWGDPGHLVRRRLLAVEGPTAPSWFLHLNMARTPWRLRIA